MSSRTCCIIFSKFCGYIGSAPQIRQSGDTEIVDGQRQSPNRGVKAVLSWVAQCPIH